MTSHASLLGDLPGALLREGKRRLLPLAALFSLVAVIALAVGLMMPKKWEASTVLVAEQSNIIKPLMEGRAVTTGIADQTAIVTQAVLSRRILREVLAFGGWLDKKRTPQEEERLLNTLRARIRIDTPREAMIRITYNDSDAKRTFDIANKLAEIYLRESAAAKEQESREAFAFISKQVKEYGDELATAHEKLLAYYRSQGTGLEHREEARIAEETPTDAPRPRLGQAPRISAEELAELRAQETTLRAQLARRPAAPAAEPRHTEEQLRARVEQLRAEYDRLLAAYTDEHPDVVRKRRDLATAKEELRLAEDARLERERARAAASALDDQVSVAAQERLEKVQAAIAAATQTPRRRGTPSATRPTTPLTASDTADPEMRGVGHDTTLSELLRRYEATRDVYQDLLKRRENARVSMDLDVARRGLSVRVQEPAEMPITAVGLRMMHKSAVGLVIALLIPFGVLFALVKLNSGVRSAAQIERLARVPLLVSIPYAPTPKEIAHGRRQRMIALLMVLVVFAVYAAAFLLTRVKSPS